MTRPDRLDGRRPAGGGGGENCFVSLAAAPTSTTPVYPSGTDILVPRIVRPRKAATKGSSFVVESSVAAGLVFDSAGFVASVVVDC